MLRPNHPQEVLSALSALALTGQVRGDCPILPWLASVRLSDRSGTVDPRWLSQLPAASERDLLRLGLLRDPRYRWHLDCSIASAASAMAQAGNWRRLEEILTGPLKVQSGVIAAVLLAQQVRTGRSVTELQPSDWAAIDATDYAEWDRHLWGHPRVVDALPVIIESYPRFAGLAVGWSDDARLASDVIPATGCPALTVIEADITPQRLADLYRLGCPMAPATLAGGRAHRWVILHPIDADPPVGSAAVGRLWDAAEGRSVLALAGAETLEDPVPPWQKDMEAARKLPSADILRDLDQQAVLRLAEDPVHGLLLQVLVQDTLDGELGQDRIALCPVLDGDHAGVIANTVVLYRPMDQANDLSRPMRKLGRIEQVMDRLAHLVGMRPIPALLHDQQPIWTAAFARMVAWGWITENGQRWHLGERASDRLHAAGFMHEVIRRARPFREQRILPALKSLWDDVEAGHD